MRSRKNATDPSSRESTLRRDWGSRRRLDSEIEDDEVENIIIF